MLADRSAPNGQLAKALDKYFEYQRRIHDTQQAPTRDEVATVYTDDCRMIFAGRNPIIGRTFEGVDDWMSVYATSFGIVEHVDIECEYTEAVGSRHAFNHDSHMMVIKGDTLRFERIDIFAESGGRLCELRILEYDQFAFDDFIRKHHPDAPSKKRQWRSHVTFGPKDDDTADTDESALLRKAVTAYFEAQLQFGGAGNVELALASVITDDAELIIQGRNPLGYGVYQGPKEWAQCLRLANTLTTRCDYLEPSLEAIGNERAFVFDKQAIDINNTTRSFNRLSILRQRDGKICQIRILYFDPYEFDEFINDHL